MFGANSVRNKTGGVFGGGVGLLMFFGAASTLGWNEVRTVEQAAANAEAARDVKTVSITQVDSANDRKPIHLSGRLETETGVEDAEFGVGGPDLVALNRSVEMYQWESYREDNETRHRKEWSSSRNDTSGSHHNPPFPVEKQWIVASDAHVGAFLLDQEEVRELPRETVFLGELGDALKAQGWKTTNAGLFRGAGSESNPDIGDVRVNFKGVKETEISVLGSQRGNQLTPYLAKNDYEVFQITTGAADSAAMVKQAVRGNDGTAWALRALGAGGMTVGLGLLFSGWLGMFSWIPFLGPLLQRMAFAVGAAIGGTMALILFSAAWLYAHPAIAFVLIVAVVALAVWLIMRRGQTPPITAALGPMPSGPPPPPPARY